MIYIICDESATYGWWIFRDSDQKFLSKDGTWTEETDYNNDFNSKRYAISVLKACEFYMQDERPRKIMTVEQANAFDQR